MSFSHPSYPEEKEARYQMLLSQSAALLDETLNPIANLANIAGASGRCSAANQLVRLLSDGSWRIDAWTVLRSARLHENPAGPRRMRHSRTKGQGSAHRQCSRFSRPHCLRQCFAKRNCSSHSPSGARHWRVRHRQPDSCPVDKTDEQYLSELVIQIQKACSFDRASYTL